MKINENTRKSLKNIRNKTNPSGNADHTMGGQFGYHKPPPPKGVSWGITGPRLWVWVWVWAVCVRNKMSLPLGNCVFLEHRVYL